MNKNFKQGKKIKNFDKFFTNKKDIEFIVQKFYDIINSFDYIIEPSAGDGRIIKYISKHFPNKKIIGFDIKPDNKEIIKENFLLLNEDKLKLYLNIQNKFNEKIKNNILILGNPPYGKNNVLAKKFILKSFEFSNNVIFVLSNSFKTINYQNYLQKFNIYIEKSFLLPNSLFDFKNKTVKLNTSVFYFTKKGGVRTSCSCGGGDDIPFLIFTKNKEEAKFIIRRVGGLAGKIIEKDIEKYSLNSNYFIKSCDKTIFNILKNSFKELNKIAKSKTVSNPSLSKIDIQNFLKKKFNF